MIVPMPVYTLYVVFILLLALAGCGDTSDECPVVTPDNVHRMTGDVPPGSPCAQVLREQVTLCALPIDQAGPPAPCQWGPT